MIRSKQEAHRKLKDMKVTRTRKAANERTVIYMFSANFEKDLFLSVNTFHFIFHVSQVNLRLFHQLPCAKMIVPRIKLSS